MPARNKQLGKLALLLALLFYTSLAIAQRQPSLKYQQQKAEKLFKKSPFEEVLERNDPEIILYQDKDVFVIEPLKKHFPVQLLIIPKKRINSLSDVSKADQKVLGKMLLVARMMADKYGIAESGYRVAINTNEDAGQSVFHVHMHLYGGANVGPMIDSEKFPGTPTKAALQQSN